MPSVELMQAAGPAAAKTSLPAISPIADAPIILLEQRAAEADLLAPGPRRSFDRALQVLRYYRKRQLAARLWQSVLASRRRAVSIAEPSAVSFDPSCAERFAEMARLRLVRTDGDLDRIAAELARGEFTLLGEQRRLATPVDWSGGRSDEGERLWAFHLHYHEYLLDVIAGGAANGRHVAETILADWIAAHPADAIDVASDAWHPYCISRRLPIWLQLLAKCEFSDELRRLALNSIAVQAEHLRRNLETDLGGNHLLENARALALVGCALQIDFANQRQRHADYLATAQAVLRREMPRQLLAHGEHFERAPMYHVHVLGNCLQIAVAAADVCPPLAEACRGWAKRMWAFIEAILHPDGEIPLLADSCFGETYPVEEIRKLHSQANVANVTPTSSLREGRSARGGAGVGSPANESRPRSEPSSLPAAGATVVGNAYWTWREGDDAWIVDLGASAADALPAHGHSDLGGFEASINGRRWLVDSGLYGYADDAMRRYCRSSLAHNVVTVGDHNQHDVWSRFRMGRRAKPSQLETGRDGDYHWARASHRAYVRLGAGELTRIVVARAGGPWVCIDAVECVPNEAVVGRLHVAPGVTIEQLDERSWHLTCDDEQRLLAFHGVATVDVAHGWYAPRMGRREATEVLQYELSPESSGCMGWTLSADWQNELPSLQFARQEGVVQVNLCDAGGTIVSPWRFRSSNPNSMCQATPR